MPTPVLLAGEFAHPALVFMQMLSPKHQPLNCPAPSSVSRDRIYHLREAVYYQLIIKIEFPKKEE